MRILYLCKRQYMGHDVILDRYARLYEQPYQLARLGHDVLGLALSYRKCTEVNVVHEVDSTGKLRWQGLSPQHSKLGILNYTSRARKIATEFNPDIIVAASDCLQIIFGNWLSKKTQAAFCVDLYDDFESFGLARIPGVKFLFRKAVKAAQVVSCVSDPLSDRVISEYGNCQSVFTLSSTVDRNIFYPREKNPLRQAYSLPLDAKIIGTGGGLSAEKGVKLLYECFLELVKIEPDLHLALAGTIDAHAPPPDHPNVHYLGKLSHAQTAEFFNMLDVGVVYIRDTPYGRYSFPQKAYEMAACGIPMTVARVGAMAALFKDSKNILYTPENCQSLLKCLRHQLQQSEIPFLHFADWNEQSRTLEAAYLQTVQIKNR